MVNAQEVVRYLEDKYPQLSFDRTYSEVTKDYGDLSKEPMNFGSYPMQATGMIDGKAFYFRFRHDHASLTVYDQDHRIGWAPLPHTDNEYFSIGEVTGEDLEGELDQKELISVLSDLLDSTLTGSLPSHVRKITSDED